LADLKNIRVVPLVCAACSNTFVAGEHDRIFYCSLCGTAWDLCGTEFSEIRIRHLAGDDPVRYPFWVFPFAMTTPAANCSTLGEYLAWTGNISTIPPERLSKPPALFVPAFSSSNPQLMSRAGRLLTLRAPVLSTIDCQPEKIVPITMNIDDARLLGESIVLSTLTEERRVNLALLQGFSMKTGPGHLFTIPFSEREGRLFQSSMNLEI
jgi:hypothetical protein